MTLAWDPNTENDLAGYNVYYGTASRVYDSVIEVGNITSYTVTDLEPETQYYFAITAYDTSGNESDFSVEVSAVPNNVDPTPDIKANGSDGPLDISSGNMLSVTVELDPGSHGGENADWWVVANTPFDWYYYNVSTDSWIPGFVVTHQGSPFDLAPREVLNRSGLPAGTYKFYFGVDLLMNRSLDFEELYFDSVDVTIE